MIEIRPGAGRYVTAHHGITSRHCFSAGAHYDPANLSFGPLLGVDEHLLAPGAGFADHAHRGVVIASWVLDGELRHESGGHSRVLGPGELFLQDASAGLRHSESNPSRTRPLRFVQTTWRAGTAARLTVERGPLALPGPLHLYVVRSPVRVAGTVLRDGDSLRADEPVALESAGEALVLSW